MPFGYCSNKSQDQSQGQGSYPRSLLAPKFYFLLSSSDFSLSTCLLKSHWSPYRHLSPNKVQFAVLSSCLGVQGIIMMAPSKHIVQRAGTGVGRALKISLVLKHVAKQRDQIDALFSTPVRTFLCHFLLSFISWNSSMIFKHIYHLLTPSSFTF